MTIHMVFILFIQLIYSGFFRILGNRVSELEKKLRTLEVSGLWNIPGTVKYWDVIVWRNHAHGVCALVLVKCAVSGTLLS